MEKNNAIRRAVRQTPAPELPAGFTGRLMERMQCEAIRRERRETWLLTVGGICCFAALIVTCVQVFWPDFRLQIPDFTIPAFRLPKIVFPHIAFPGADKSLVGMCICIALICIVLLLADLLIRRRLASSRN